MPFDLLLTDDGDLPAGPARPATGLALIQQRIRRRLRTIRGEWFLDPAKGLPYLEWIATRPPPTAAIASLTRQTVLEVPGVVRVEDWAATHDNEARKVTVTGVIVTDTDDALTLRIEGVEFTSPINTAPWAIILEELL